jgi:enoyl-CoA hydratase/carnithine racemase
MTLTHDVSLSFVDLDADVPALASRVTARQLRIGIARGELREEVVAFARDLDCALAAGAGPAPIWAVPVADVDAAADVIAERVTRSPGAAGVLRDVLRVTSAASVTGGLVAESLAYSMLLAGPEFARWRAARPRREIPPASEPVRVKRTGDRLDVTLNRPDRRNAFGREVRDAVIEALDLALLDRSIEQVHLHGAGPSFCSGGDLDEFGTAPDVVTAHHIRIERSVAARIDALRDRCFVHLHGACVGAGIELPSFAGYVGARPDTVIQLPELELGLIPGAGGTVGITRRIGRWRSAYLALSGAKLDAATALEWGLIDEIECEAQPA